MKQILLCVPSFSHFIDFIDNMIKIFINYMIKLRQGISFMYLNLFVYLFQTFSLFQALKFGSWRTSASQSSPGMQPCTLY